MELNLFDYFNYLLEGTIYLQENEFIVKITLNIDGTASLYTNTGRVIPSDVLENL